MTHSTLRAAQRLLCAGLVTAGSLAAQPVYREAGPPPVLPSLPMGNAPASSAMQDYQACVRANAKTLELIRAATAVVQAVRYSRTPIPAEKAVDTRAALDRQFAHYRALGGTATAPEAVEIPPDPCQASAGQLRDEHLRNQRQYAECLQTRGAEVKLANLSREVVAARSWLAANDKTPAAPGAGRAAATAGAAAPMDPVRMRASQAALFAEYQAAGGQANRVEDVTVLPNPCVKSLPGPPRVGNPASATVTQRAQPAAAR